MTGLNEVGKAIVEKVSSSDSLVDINMICHAIEQACLFGYEDLAERLASSNARCAREMMAVVEEFTQAQQSQKMGGM